MDTETTATTEATKDPSTQAKVITLDDSDEEDLDTLPDPKLNITAKNLSQLQNDLHLSDEDSSEDEVDDTTNASNKN
jgi:hypothetical protein